MPEPKVFRDRHGARLDLRKNSHVGSPQFLISNISGTAVQFVVEPESLADFVGALFATMHEQAFLVEDVDTTTADCHLISAGHAIHYEAGQGTIRYDNHAVSARLEPDVAVEVGTWLTAFGRRAQKEAAEISTAVQDMALDMADMPWAPPDGDACLLLAAAMVRAGYGRRPADG